MSNEDDFEQSLDARSDFIPFGQPMDQSLVATSEKVYFENASTINREELQKDKKHLLPVVGEQTEEESANEFLDVGKWKRAKDSTMSKDLEGVKQEVEQIITQSKWRKKDKVEEGAAKKEEKEKGKEVPVKKVEVVEKKEEKVIHDLGKNEEEQEEIADETEQDEEQEQQEQEEQQQEQQEQEEQEQQEEQEEQDEDQQEESQEQQEQQQQEEQQEEQQHELTQHQALQALEQPQQLPVKTPAHSHQSKQSARTKNSSEPQKLQPSMLSEDDRTDTRSQMKKTEYLPTKWTKKGSSQMPMEDPWARKEAILMRIAKLVA